MRKVQEIASELYSIHERLCCPLQSPWACALPLIWRYGRGVGGRCGGTRVAARARSGSSPLPSSEGVVVPLRSASSSSTSLRSIRDSPWSSTSASSRDSSSDSFSSIRLLSKECEDAMVAVWCRCGCARCLVADVSRCRCLVRDGVPRDSRLEGCRGALELMLRALTATNTNVRLRLRMRLFGSGYGHNQTPVFVDTSS